MAYTRFNYDECRTRVKNKQSVDIGMYHINVPGNGTRPAFIEDPNIRLQKWAANRCENHIDIDSQLRGIDKQLKCNVHHTDIRSRPVNYPANSLLNVESTRYSNPAWNIRGNEYPSACYLHRDPQANAVVPFMCNVSSRIYQKDVYVSSIYNVSQKV